MRARMVSRALLALVLRVPAVAISLVMRWLQLITIAVGRWWWHHCGNAGDGDSSYRPVRGEFSMSTDEQQPASADRPATEVLSIEEVSAAKEIVISAHESAHAVAAVRLGLHFEYVTLGSNAEIYSHLQPVDNQPRPIGFYTGGSCCGQKQPMCERCRAEENRAESWILMSMCGSLGANSTGCDAFGYGLGADKMYVEDFCRTAFGDQTYVEINARIKRMLRKANELMLPENETVTAVSRALRTRRRLTEAEVKDIMQESRANG